MIEFDITFNDLTKEAQERISEYIDIDDVNEDIPLATLIFCNRDEV